MWFMHDVGGWWMWFGSIAMFIIWGGFIGLIIWAVLRFTKRDSSTKQTSLSIAEERYARGEISKEEFEQIKKDLR